jgi:hypothetical protein
MTKKPKRAGRNTKTPPGSANRGFAVTRGSLGRDAENTKRPSGLAVTPDVRNDDGLAADPCATVDPNTGQVPATVNSEPELPRHDSPALVPSADPQLNEPLPVQVSDSERDRDAAAEASPDPTVIVPDLPTSDALTNGDEAYVRMEEIQKILEHAATPVLDKCALIAEWGRHAEAKGSGQVVINPQGGRPEGGVTRAAKELPVRGKTLGARRKFIERAIKIDAIWADAKFAIRAAKLDNNQAALLDIADEPSLEKQLAEIQEIKNRPRGSGRNNSTQAERNGGIAMTHRDANTTSIPPIAYEALTSEQKEHLAVLQTSWRKDKVVYREDFEKAPLAVQQYFLWNDMIATAGNQVPAQIDADPADPSPSEVEFPTAPTEVQAAGSASADVNVEAPTSSSEQPW